MGSVASFAQDEVRGIGGAAHVHVDRYFYWLDPSTDFIWEVDGYSQPVPEGAPPQWMLLVMCPRCQNVLRLESKKKAFEIDARGIETAEPFKCTWPVDQDGYRGVCPWAAELQRPNKIIKMPMTTKSGARVEVKIDAMIRQAK
jgi:hypothetical protein